MNIVLYNVKHCDAKCVIYEHFLMFAEVPFIQNSSIHGNLYSRVYFILLLVAEQATVSLLYRKFVTLLCIRYKESEATGNLILLLLPFRGKLSSSPDRAGRERFWRIS